MYRAHLPDGARPRASNLSLRSERPGVRLRPKQAAMLDRASAIPSGVLDGQINTDQSRPTGGEPWVLAPLLFPVA